MIVAKDFVYLHNPKTGGTFVRAMLRRLGEAYPELEISNLMDLQHAGLKKIPRAHRGKTFLTTVRHPLSHYVSRYHFAGWEKKLLTQSRASLIREHYPRFPNLTFSQFLELRNDWNIIQPEESKLRRVLIDKNIGSQTTALLGLVERDPCGLLEKLDDLTEESLANRFKNVRFLMTENLNEDLRGFLLTLGLKPQQVAFIREQDPIYPTKKFSLGRRWRHFWRDLGKKEDWREYYTQEEADWICHLERFFFKLFPDNYQRPGTDRPTTQPVRRAAHAE